MVYTLPLSQHVNLPPIGVNYHGETYYGSTLSNWRLNERIHRERNQSQKASMNRASLSQKQPQTKTQCGQCQSLASKSFKLQEDLETKKVLLAEKEGQIADLIAGNWWVNILKI